MKRRSQMKFTVAVIAIVVFALLAACSNNGKSATESPASSASQKPQATSTESSHYPESLSYWVPINSEVAATLKDYNGMGMYKQLESITGTKVEFQHPPEGQEQDQFNLMLATGNLPDVIDTRWLGTQPDLLITDGKILRLNELIEAHAPNLAKLLKEKPDIRKAITTDDGNIYVFPSIADDPTLTIFNGLIVRKDWLDKLGLQPPETIADWEKMLTAFRDNDPNGNGEKDEIPFLYAKHEIFFSYAFAGAFGITTDFYNDEGTVKYGPYEPAFKDFLALMNKWYTEGLIDKDYLTVDQNIMDAKITNNQIGSFDGWVGGGIGKYTGLMKDSNPEFKLMGVRFPSLEPGGEVVAKIQAKFSGMGAAISASAKNPEQIAAWLDYGYSEEGHLLFNFGIEGESYTLVDGKPAFTERILNNPDKLPVSQALAQYTRMGSNGPFEFSAEGYRQYNAMPEQIEAKANWAQASHDKLLPDLSLTVEEQEKRAAIMTDLLTYQDEMVNKFIMGVESLDKFDDYIATLKKFGIEEQIHNMQNAYERYLNK